MRNEQLATLIACVDAGTFERAATALGLTPSAVSQRIKALEQAVGRVVLVRSSPVRPTEVGARILRTARQRALLDADLRRELAADPDAELLDLPVAVNADSLATWFREVLATVAEWGDCRLRLFVQDQDVTAHLLRTGTVLGAVTASADPVQGCTVSPLGTMRYTPLVLESTWRHWAARAPGPDPLDVLAVHPTLVFDRDDALQRDALRAVGLEEPALPHVVPSSEGFVDAIVAGLGWGLVPEGMERPGLIEVPGLAPVDVALFWQAWRLDTPAVARLTDEVTSAAHSLR